MLSIKNIQITVFLAASLLGSACTSHDSRLYEGKVFDQQGKPVSDVTVRICYIGWGLGEAGGVIWDKVYCSETVVTDESGIYKVKFAAPPSAYLLARKKDWVQINNFLARDNRIILVQKKDYLRRQVEQEARKERIFLERKPNESNTEYYCRVIRKRSDKVTMNYRDHNVTFFQTLMHSGKPLLAIKGSYDLVKPIADELIIREGMTNGGKILYEKFIILPRNIACNKEIYFIQADTLKYPSLPDNMHKVEATVPGMHAGFSMNIWKQE